MRDDSDRGRFGSARCALLEVLVEAELAGTLDRVSDEGGRPAAHESGEPLLLHRDAEALGDAGVPDGIGLHVALHHVQRRHLRATRDTSD